ncbi:uncharacterized protein LOC126840826 [Adelges cooleyi]|uniref:uncharacterized protein LOC126840826 n=1 Tax=Adelges cooleyi TaxID=133065 RepID=UPI00217F98F6|nr:uncharacterized protein LOC126840826 [Adelges cooleyi]
MFRLFAVIILFILGVFTSGKCQSDNEEDLYRLPGDTVPVFYLLRCGPDFDRPPPNFPFVGYVEITILVKRITQVITLNAVQIEVGEIKIEECITQTPIGVIGQQFTDYERLKIYTEKPLLVGRNYRVTIPFQGLLRADMTGFYKSSYKVDGILQWAASTQLEPTYARRMFPCYDEPAYRTPFSISIARRVHQMSLSNMELNSTVFIGYPNWIVDSYKTTPPISTYMVSMFVGKFDGNTNEMPDDLTVNIYTRSKYATQIDYALEKIPMLLDAMENFTRIPYEWPKTDIVAVPDFGGSGTENWGLSAFREKYLFVNGNSSARAKVKVTSMIQHELAQQWFGNLVTCSWWKDVWLKKGFAVFFQYFIIQSIYPEWRMDKLFVIEQHQTALALDQLPAHPVSWSVLSTEDIDDMFDQITYNKAAAVLRMLKNTVGETNFRVPLTLYLNQSEFGSASSRDLWAIFDNYYFDNRFELDKRVPFTYFMMSWTEQPGYPVVHVKNTNEGFTITQEKFTVYPTNGTDASKWFIGLTYTTDKVKNFENLTSTVWMDMAKNMTVKMKDNAKWFIFNLQSSGFYRVNYASDNWLALIQQLNESYREVHVLNRAQLIDDSFNLARAGLLNYSIPLELSKYLEKEEDAIPWYSSILSFSYLLERMRRSVDGYDYLKDYVRNLAEIIYVKAETSVQEYDKDQYEALIKWNVFSAWACSLNSQKCVRNNLEYFKRWQSGKDIPADIKDAAFCVGVMASNMSATWDDMLDVYTSTNSISEKESAQTALTCTSNPRLLNRYLNFIFDGAKSPVRLQDFRDICTAMVSTPIGIEVLTDFLMNNLEQIVRRVPDGEEVVKFIYATLASKVSLDREIIKLYKLKSVPELPQSLKKSFERSYRLVELNIYWFNEYHDSVNLWLGVPVLPDEPTTLAPTHRTTQPTHFTTNATTAQYTTNATTVPYDKDTTEDYDDIEISSGNSHYNSLFILKLVILFVVLKLFECLKMLFKFLTFYALVQGLNGFNTFLPTATVPKSYSLAISPNFENKDASFVGLVEILIQTEMITGEVILHSKDLQITSVNVTKVSTSREITVKEWKFIQEDEQVKIVLDNMLPPNEEYMIAIRFNGSLRNDMTGFYKSSYSQSQTGAENFLAVTQFEATYARSAFPCYDEPHYKVPFNITVGVPDKQIALSNMPLLYKDQKDVYALDSGRRLTWYHFQQTPPISTYLVAFFVGDFVSWDSSSKVNVYTRNDNYYLKQTKYALDVAPKLLKAMELFTGIKYELPKLDLVALPDLGFGAMENWGMNTFRERLLLLPEDSTTLYKGAVTKIIQHELSHQWFGNLVTCDWWDYVWLNEGFATFFEYFATATVEPDWQSPEFFVVEQHQTGLEYDQIARHALSNKVSTPEEIDNTFDHITYNKGGSVLRMLYSYVGKDVFKEALNLYLTKHMEESVRPSDLWDAFEKTLAKCKQTLVKDHTVNEVMSTWTEQSGYPVVNVTKAHDAVSEYGYRFTQEKFTVDEPLVNHSTKWFIGVTIANDLKPTFDNLTPVFWLNPKDDEYILKPDHPVMSYKWYIVNLQSTGFYRVNYENNNWLALIEQLKNAPEVLHVLNRAQLVDDSFNLARAGRLNYTVPLELTNYLDKENDVIPWYSVMNSFNYILDRMRRSPLYSEIENYVSDKALIIFTKLQLQVEEKKNKTYAINAGWNTFSVWACKLNVPTCVIPATSYFNAWLKGEKIPDDQKDVAFCVGLKFHPEADTWSEVFQVYLNTQSASERYSALNALACTQNQSLLRNYVELILKGPNGLIRPQDYRAVFISLSSTSLGIQTLLFFLRDNWDRICKELPDGESVAETIYSVLASKVSLDSEIYIMNKIRSKSGVSSTLKKNYDSLYKQVEINHKWFDTYSNDINEFVRLNSSKDDPISPRTSSASPTNSVGSLSTITCFTIIQIIFQLIIYFK